jgi:SAM-dependent methyltransferase
VAKILTYNPDVFSVGSLADAKAIILTDEEGVDSGTRWESETPYLAELISAEIAPKAEQLVIDYGCGIGRLSKLMIEQFGCTVIGVDISANMRALAASYVGSDRFFACAPAMLDDLLARGVRADAAIAVWVLQHCFAPTEDIERLRAALVHRGRLFVVNNKDRAVPTMESAWVHDGIDIRQALEARFKARRVGTLDPARVGQAVTDFSFTATYTR